MTNSFFPKTDAGIIVWATNYKDKLEGQATALGLTPDQVAKETGYCNKLIDAVNAVDNQKKELKSRIKEKNSIIETDGGALRTEISRHKMAEGYTEVIGNNLGITSTYVDFDPATYKTKLSTELYGGFVRIKFRKKGAEGVNIYHRKKGSANWDFLARATKSPFDNHITLETPNQPEHWEYRAFGVISDAEIGIASDIVEIVYGA